MFFFFKQKTAYEMRISDWSSDVCSSDLVPSAQGPPSSESRSSAGTRCSGNRAFQAYRSCPPRLRPATSPGKQFLGPRAIGPYVFGQRLKPVKLRFGPQIMVQFDCDLLAVKVAGKIEQMHLQQFLRRIEHRAYADVRGPVEYPPVGKAAAHRSEEHTSELQSLMRSSYAVF